MIHCALPEPLILRQARWRNDQTGHDEVVKPERGRDKAPFFRILARPHYNLYYSPLLV